MPAKLLQNRGKCVPDWENLRPEWVVEKPPGDSSLLRPREARQRPEDPQMLAL